MMVVDVVLSVKPACVAPVMVNAPFTNVMS